MDLLRSVLLMLGGLMMLTALFIGGMFIFAFLALVGMGFVAYWKLRAGNIINPLEEMGHRGAVDPAAPPTIEAEYEVMEIRERRIEKDRV